MDEQDKKSLGGALFLDESGDDYDADDMEERPVVSPTRSGAKRSSAAKAPSASKNRNGALEAIPTSPRADKLDGSETSHTGTTDEANGSGFDDESAVREDDDLSGDDDFGDAATAAGEGTPAIDDDKANEAADILFEILERMALDTEVEVQDDAEQIVLNVDGPDAGRVIGKKGQTLDALQFLINKIVNRFPEGRRHVVVDCNGYRGRHDRGLTQMAKREAKRAVEIGKVITLEPMNARDRRVVHLSLAKFTNVETSSEGEGLHRRIKIVPKGASQRNGRNSRSRPRVQNRRDGYPEASAPKTTPSGE